MKKHAGREIKIRTGNTDTEPIIGKLEPEKGYTLYVDDCSTRASGDDVNIVKKRQKDATLAIFRSMRESRLCINADKTQIMLIMSNQRRKGMKRQRHRTRTKKISQRKVISQKAFVPYWNQFTPRPDRFE